MLVIAGGLVWMHGNSGDMDAGGWHAIGDFVSGRVREKERADERNRRGLWQRIFADCGRNRGIALILHAVDGQGMIGMVLRYYMTGICGS